MVMLLSSTSKTIGFIMSVIVSLSYGKKWSSTQKNDIEKFIKDVMACRNIPGLTLGVVHDDMSFVDGYGVVDLKTKHKVNSKTIFCIASITKGFTAAVLGIALQRSRRWNWDTPVSEILGKNFKLSDDFRTKYLTIKDTLTHRSGVPGYVGAFYTGYNIDRETLVSRLQYLRPTHPAHSKFLYNNHMYLLAGYVAEKITGKTWEELVQEEIFDKLEMTSSTFVKDIGSGPDVAKSHTSINGTLVELDKILNSILYPAGPAGSICSNAEDMVKWLTFQLRKSVLPSGERLINKRMFDAMHTPHMPTPLVLGYEILKPPAFPISEGIFAYDLGWGSGTYRGYQTVIHSGHLAGYISNIWLLPDANIGIFSSTNGPNRLETWYALRTIHHYISDVLLGLDPWLNSSTACSFPDPWLSDFRQRSAGDDVELVQKSSQNNTMKPPALADFVGTYGHLAFGNITIRLNAQDKRLHLYHGRYGHAILERTSDPMEFDMKFIDELLFVSEADGWKKTLKVLFYSPDGQKVDVLYPSFIEGSAVQAFFRDLKWTDHDQPGMTSRESGQCFNNCASTSTCISYLALCFIIFWYL